MQKSESRENGKRKSDKIKLSLADKFVSYRKVYQIRDYDMSAEDFESYRGCGKVKIVAAIKANEELYVI